MSHVRLNVRLLPRCNLLPTARTLARYLKTSKVLPPVIRPLPSPHRHLNRLYRILCPLLFRVDPPETRARAFHHTRTFRPQSLSILPRTTSVLRDQSLRNRHPSHNKFPVHPQKFLRSRNLIQSLNCLSRHPPPSRPPRHRLLSPLRLILLQIHLPFRAFHLCKQTPLRSHQLLLQINLVD